MRVASRWRCWSPVCGWSLGFIGMKSRQGATADVAGKERRLVTVAVRDRAGLRVAAAQLGAAQVATPTGQDWGRALRHFTATSESSGTRTCELTTASSQRNAGPDAETRGRSRRRVAGDSKLYAAPGAKARRLQPPVLLTSSAVLTVVAGREEDLRWLAASCTASVESYEPSRWDWLLRFGVGVNRRTCSCARGRPVPVPPRRTDHCAQGSHDGLSTEPLRQGPCGSTAGRN